jgi:hypothetical protein
VKQLSDAERLRAHVDRLKTYLREHPNSIQVRQAAVSVAGYIGARHSHLRRKAEQLPRIRLAQPYGAPSPAARDGRFDAAVEEFIAACDQALDELEEHGRAVRANATLSRAECRKRVLAFLAANPTIEWGADVAWALRLSDDQIHDALEHLESRGAIDYGGLRGFIGGNWAWHIRLNSYGRDMADGLVSDVAGGASTVVTNVHNVITNSSVGVAGVSHGLVVQTNIPTFPTMPPDVRDELQKTAQGRILSAALDAELAKPVPQKETLRDAVEGISTAMETVNAGSEFIGHLTEWMSAAGDFIGSLVG